MRKSFVVFSVLCITLLLLILGWLFRPLDPSVTVLGISDILGCSHIVASIGGTDYKLYGSKELVEMFKTESWKRGSTTESQVILTFHISELYELYLYHNGCIEIYDGYARLSRRGRAAYLSEEIDPYEIVDYVLTRGNELAADNKE